jgi:nicotinate-nucleotide pyrophosphorylase (carboxylating)
MEPEPEDRRVTLHPPPALLTDPIVRRGLEEDLGRAGDVTTDAIVAADEHTTARIVARTAGRVAALRVACSAFGMLDDRVAVQYLCEDGDDVESGETLAVLLGPARAILSAERTALNLLGRMCGIATETRTFVEAAGSGARIVDTRKTTPGLRVLEKYAVRCGGGANHRYGLHDAVLIKDNHVALAGGVAEAVRRARRSVGPLVKIEVEVDTLEQFEEALGAGVDLILLDNMAPSQLRRAVEAGRGRVVLEASGGVTASTIGEVAATGVDFISVGRITHSAPALDVALEVDWGERSGESEPR